MTLRFQAGVSLLEILVTTLVLGIGLLGVAALQVSSVSSNQEGFFATQATSIAEDYASRVRSGRLVTSVYNPNSTDSASAKQIAYITRYHTGGALTCGATPPTMCRSDNGTAPSTQCDAATIATFDRWEICDIAKNTLPGGQVRALRNGNRMTIVVEWDAIGGRSDLGTVNNVNANCSSTFIGVDSARNCVIMEIVP